MRIPIHGLLVAAAFLLSAPDRAVAQSGSIPLLLSACQRGNMAACNAVSPLVGNACRQGDQRACRLQNSIRADRQNGRSAEAVNTRALHQRCFSGDALACKRLQEGPPQGDAKAGNQPDLPGMNR